MNQKLAELQTRPPTHILSTRMDGRHLATLALFWHQTGETPRSTSELLRLSLEAFCELLVTNGKVDFISSHSDALETLQRLGITAKGVNSRHLIDALKGEDGNLNLSSLTTAPDPAASHRRTKTSRKGRPDDLTLTQALAKLEEGMSDDLATRTKEAQSRTEDFKKSLGMIPDEITPISEEGGE